MNFQNDLRVTYINKITNEYWEHWKLWKDCTEEEKNKVNLRQIFNNEIVLDLEDKNYSEIIKQLITDGNQSYKLINTQSRGFHIHLIIIGLEQLNKEQRKEYRKLFIKNYSCDLSKASEETLISIEGRPHFKSNKEVLVQEDIPGENFLDQDLLQETIKISENKNKILPKDINFENYHVKDNFFNYIKNNKILENQERNNIVFPNIAIALVKEGLSEEAIEEIMAPIITNNFPGKIYGEFKGWVKKAFANEITDYNKVLINKWMEEYSDTYDKPYETDKDILIEEIKSFPEEHKKFIQDKDFENLKNIKVEWIIEDWLPKGDISAIVGKAGSFKTTLALHFAYAIAEGKLVFNKYNTKQSKVLYLNEENNNATFLDMIKRVKNGLDLINFSDNIYFSLLENFKFDNSKDMEEIIAFINKEGINILICDSFRRFFLGQENDATLMNKLFNNFKAIRNRCSGLNIVLIHHTKKDNAQFKQDVRDMMRGSSDFINFLDSAIDISRKHGKDVIVINHAKIRARHEILGKVIAINTSDDKSYFYESSEEANKELILSKPEKCAEEILKLIEDKKLKTFKRQEIDELMDKKKYSHETIYNALKMLIDDGTLTSSGERRHLVYVVV